MTANELTQWAIAAVMLGFAASMWLVVLYTILKCVALFLGKDDSEDKDDK